MKVVKHGNQARDWTHEATCSHCGCVMLAEESDVTWSYAYADDPPTDLTVKCPECFGAVAVCALDDVPRPVRGRMDSERARWAKHAALMNACWAPGVRPLR